MRTEFLCISVLRAASESRVKLASCKSALNPPVVCSTGERSIVNTHSIDITAKFAVSI